MGPSRMTHHVTNNQKSVKYGIFFIAAFLMLLVASGAKAANVGDVVNFNVDQNFDVSARAQVPATLVKTTSSLYFYVETNWWNAQVPAKQTEMLTNLDNASTEFSNKIYPTLTSMFGTEWNPGIDGNNTITVLFHSIKENAGGYFRSADEYIKLQVPDSNEREMLYLSTIQIDSPRLPGFLAHEFVHLVTFNQKNRTQSVQEEVWLNEARADYVSTVLGYDDAYQGSNLERRVNDFLIEPSNSLTEWQNTKYDYAVENVFMHYLVDRYGIHVLTDSLKSKLVGIASINEVLAKSGAKEDFAQIFTDWTITLIINSCSQNTNYCYVNQNLNNLKINPNLIFLPLTGSSSLSSTNITKNWSGNWQKIIGGNGDLKLEFSSLPGLNFQVPYIIYDKNNNYVIKFLKLDQNQKGQIAISDFGTKYNSLIIIPSLQTKLSGFDGLEPIYSYTFTVSISQTISQGDPALLQKLQDTISALKKQIADILARNNGQTPDSNVCVALHNNLYVGVLNDSDVRCLQQFLKNQGAAVYPEGLVTGVFGNLTKMAVMRLQQKYGILQTGFVGILTRTKINSLLQN